MPLAPTHTDSSLIRLCRFIAVCTGCVLAIGIVTAEPLDDADTAYNRGDYAQAIKLFRPIAVKGNVVAQYRMGSMYASGQGVGQDYQVALYWYRLAALQGDVISQNILGWMYIKGDGIGQDYHEAMHWYRLAAEHGNAAAQFSLGSMYANGQGVDQDYQAAAKWYRLASSQGNAGAQFNLGWMYDHGQGVSRDYPAALKWFRMAATQGLAVAQTQLGIRYIGGLGVDQDYPAALKWFRLAAAQREPAGQFHLGWMYDSGQGVVQDYQEAIHWYNLSAEQGYGPAISILERPSMVSSALKIAAMQAHPQYPQRPLNSALNGIKGMERSIVPWLIFESSSLRPDGSIELSGRITSTANITQVMINGRDLEVPLSRDGSFRVTRIPPLGVTSYWLSVLDEYGQRVDAEVSFERKTIHQMEDIEPLEPHKMKAKVKPDAVALIIGIESYANLPQAQYANSDASHFYHYAHHALGVPTNRIKLLTDSQAGRAELLKAMRSWMRAEIVGGRSDVYIFFAGHGLSSSDGSKTYLLPTDGDPSLLDETSILRDDLIASAKGAQTITLFLDTCYSGVTRTNELLITDARPIVIAPNENGLPANVTLLAAATGSQISSSYEGAQQGLFSYWLMKGLEGGAESNSDRMITAGELHEYVSKRVMLIAARRNRQQDPQLIGDRDRILVSY